MRKLKYSPEELINDPSLKLCDYLFGEALYSHLHKKTVRFVRYEKEKVRVASVMSIQELPELVDKLEVHRVTSGPRAINVSMRKVT